MKSEYTVIKRLLRTEKGLDHSESQNRYQFEVAFDANKIEVRKAIEKIYKVKVNSVSTLIVPSKPKILRRDPGKTSEWKKAIVALKKGDKIDLTA